MKARLVGLAAGLGAVALAASCWAGSVLFATVDGTAKPIAVQTAAVPLNADDPKQTRVGDFVYAGGLDITSKDTDRLHDLSDLNITPDGHLTSEGDNGQIFTARLALDAKGRLAGLGDAHFGWLKGKDGARLDGKTEADAEGLAIWPNGDLMISFERHHRIWRYPAKGGPPIDLPIPADPQMTGNEGMEGLALAPAQGADAYWVGVENGDIFLCRLASGCEAKTALPRPPPKYRLSGMTETPDGRLAILFHSFQGLGGSHIKVVLVDAPASAAPQAVDGFALDPPQTVDNFEGIAGVMRPGGVLRLYLIVDDNSLRAERTLLLAFDRMPQGGKK